MVISPTGSGKWRRAIASVCTGFLYMVAAQCANLACHHGTHVLDVGKPRDLVVGQFEDAPTVIPSIRTSAARNLPMIAEEDRFAPEVAMLRMTRFGARYRTDPLPVVRPTLTLWSLDI